MRTISSTEAKSNFGALLDTAQREPVIVQKKGRSVAVMVSMADFEAHEALKLAHLQRDLREGIEQADRGELYNGDEVFNALLKS